MTQTTPLNVVAPTQTANGIHDFTWPLSGWYAVRDRMVILSMVISRDEGKGHVGGLLDRWKTEFDVVVVPTPSGKMRAMCERRGFTVEWQWSEEFGEHVECLTWRKQS